MKTLRLSLKRQTKAMLARRVRVLTRVLEETLAERNALYDEFVAYTAEETIPQGTTIRVRVPRRFLPQ